MQGLLGAAVSDVGCLASARGSSQRGLAKLCARALERESRKVASVADCVRLTECGGREAQWVTRCPTRPEFCMKSHLWRVAILVRLALPLPHLRLPQKGCECHVRFDAATMGETWTADARLPTAWLCPRPGECAHAFRRRRLEAEYTQSCPHITPAVLY